MIVVRVQLQVKPENRAAFLNTFSKDAVISRGFDGCQSFALLNDVENEAAFTLYEEWASAQAFDSFRNSEHMQASGKAFFPLLDGKPISHYYEAAPIS